MSIKKYKYLFIFLVRTVGFYSENQQIPTDKARNGKRLQSAGKLNYSVSGENT